MHARHAIFSLLLLVASAVPALAGPPWVSIEMPANPFDSATRGAYFIVRTYHHGNPVALQVRGRMEGIVDGRRVTRAITFERTRTAGLWALKTAPPEDGAWVVVVFAGDGDYSATALVDVSDGVVQGIEVPTRPINIDGVMVGSPREVRPSEIEARLTALASADPTMLLAKPGHGAGNGPDLTLLLVLGAAIGLVPVGAFAIRRSRRPR